MKKIIALLSVFLVSIFVGIGFGQVLNINPLIPGTISFIGSFIPLPSGSMYLLLYTSPAVAATYAFNLTYLPEFLTWNDAGVPITLCRVETQEDGDLHEYNAAAIAAANNYRMLGAQVANQVTLRIADGYIKDKNTTITVTTAAAAAIAFFGWSDNIGVVPFTFKNAAILALNPTDFMKFTAVFIPALVAATSRIDVEFKDGHRQTLAVADLLSMSSFRQQVPGIIIDNLDQYIHKATVNSVAAVASYILAIKLSGQA